jgi:hypothetical protein
MSIKTELEDLLEQNIRATRAGNAIRLAHSLGIDVTVPEARARVLRQLELVEAEFAGDDS